MSSFYDNPNITYNKWIDWYRQVPDSPPAEDEDEKDEDEDDEADDAVDTTTKQPAKVEDMDPAQQARVNASIMRIGDQRINGVVTRKGKSFGAIDFGTVKYASLNDYLKAEQLGDRTGRFSGVEFTDKDARNKNLERGAEALAVMDPTALTLAAIPFASAFETKVIQDPTGQFTRAIPKAGIFNPIATMAIAEEYRELYALKEFRAKNPGVVGKEGGFAFNFGNVNIWRRPGEVLYRGQLDRAGLNQQTATSYEQFINGAAQGKQVVAAMLAKSDPNDDTSTEIVVNAGDRIVLQTENGGYLLNGNFHYGSGIARMGYMEDMEALAASVFSAGGKLSKQESMSIAQRWRSSAHSLDRSATTAEKLANLQSFIDAATTLNQNNEAAAIAAQKAAEEAAEAQAREERAQAEMRQRQEEAAAAADAAARDRDRDRDEDGGPSGNEYGFDSGQSFGVGSSGGFAGALAEGGRVGLAMGGAPRVASGFVDRPPDQVPEDQTVADNRPTQLPEGAFVINAAAAEFMGTSDVRKMLIDAHEEALRRGIVVDKRGNGAKLIDVAISSGEVVVAPHLAKIIGYDRLNKINNRGMAETRERIRENGQDQAPATMQAATGMLISGQMVKPTLTQQDLREQGFLSREYPAMPDTPIPSRDEDTYFGYRFGSIKDAIKSVEIKGFEDNPFIFTGVRKKGGKSSSAFGPMQITSSTLRDFKERSPEYNFLDDSGKKYVDDLIQQGDDKVNIDLYQKIYRNKKAQPTAKETKQKFGRYGQGVIPREAHEKHYNVVADMVLRLKLSDHENIRDAIASYGEGSAYANKVLKSLE